MPHKDPVVRRAYIRRYRTANPDKIRFWEQASAQKAELLFPGRRRAEATKRKRAWKQRRAAHRLARQATRQLRHAKALQQRNLSSYPLYRAALLLLPWLLRQVRLRIPRQIKRAQQRMQKNRHAAIYRTENRDKINAKQKALRDADPKAHATRVKEWRANNVDINRAMMKEHNERRRAEKAGAAIANLSDAQWKEIKTAFGHRCAYCGRKMKRLEKDHITPVIDKGNHHVHNIVPACRSCNSKKFIGPPLKPVQPLLLTIAPATKKKKTD